MRIRGKVIVVFRFGPAGKPYGFKGDMIKAVNYVRKEGLNAMEYEAVRGVNIKEDKAKALGEEAMKLDVKLSLHAPYYINLSSEDEKVLKGSVRRLVDALKASEWMGAYVVVYHPGYYKGLPREEAVRKVVNALKEVWNEARSFGVRNVWLGPETTGKTSQVGSLEDIVEICSSSEKCRPVVDWAHLHARSRGEYITSIDDVIQVIEFLEKNLGREALKPLHQHFSKIEYGEGGEKEHHTLSEEEYGPDFKIVCKALLQTGVDSVIISESPVLDKDALLMKRVCEEMK